MISSISRRTLAVLAGGALLASSGAFADSRENRYLIVTAVGDPTSDTQLALAESALAEAGIAFDKYVATANGIPKAQPLVLIDSGGKPLYTGVVLTTGQVLFQNAQSGWESGLSPSQWAQLETYEKAHDVRRVSLYSVPGPDLGLEYAGSTGDETTLAVASAAAMLPGLDALGELPLAGSWRYPGKLLPESKASPVLTFAGDPEKVAAAHVEIDARRQLHFFFSQSAASETSRKIAPLWISWLKKDLAPPPAGEDAFAGTWKVRFPAFDQSFDGVATFSEALGESDERLLKWSIGAHVYAGIGLRADKMLRAAWSQNGDVMLAVYDVSAAGYAGRVIAESESGMRGSEVITGFQPNVVSGTFNVRGTNEEGDFLGLITVQRQSRTYVLQRQVNGQTMRGIGRRIGDQLVVAYSAEPLFGLVSYEETEDGLNGVWLRYGHDQLFDQVLTRAP